MPIEIFKRGVTPNPADQFEGKEHYEGAFECDPADPAAADLCQALDVVGRELFGSYEGESANHPGHKVVGVRLHSVRFTLIYGPMDLFEGYGSGEERREVDDYAHRAQRNPVTAWSHDPEGGSPTFDEEQ